MIDLTADIAILKAVKQFRQGIAGLKAALESFKDAPEEDRTEDPLVYRVTTLTVRGAQRGLTVALEDLQECESLIQELSPCDITEHTEALVGQVFGEGAVDLFRQRMGDFI